MPSVVLIARGRISDRVSSRNIYEGSMSLTLEQVFVFLSNSALLLVFFLSVRETLLHVIILERSEVVSRFLILYAVDF